MVNDVIPLAEITAFVRTDHQELGDEKSYAHLPGFAKKYSL